MRTIAFSVLSFDQFNDWKNTDKQIHERIVRLIHEILRNPFEGTGKPEPLKHELKGYWSRRINDEHRLVYKVTEEQIIIVACKYHYSR